VRLRLDFEAQKRRYTAFLGGLRYAGMSEENGS
jgi:hypothetical protein